MFYVSICLIVRDDHRYIEEWISYHRLIGIDHFYITDNKSQPPLKSILQPYIDQGLVTYRYDTRDRPQHLVYNECLKAHGKDNKWIAFIDSDEFLVLKKNRNIKEFLRNYEKYGAVAVNWYLFGSNGYKKRQKSVINSYKKRLCFSTHSKVIIRPNRCLSICVHRVQRHTPGYYTVYEDFTRRRGGQRANVKLKRKISNIAEVIQRKSQKNPRTNLIQLNHYFLRSKQDFKDKLKRGGGIHAHNRNMNTFHNIDKLSTVYDDTIIKLQNQLLPSS